MTRIERAEQLRRALQLYAQSLADDTAMEIPAVFDEWRVGVQITADTIVTYGVNSVGDPQLYRCVQPHLTAEGWEPDKVPALFTPIGVDPQGYPIWAQPTGAHDAYNTGDIVRYEPDGKLYISTIDANVYEPGVFGWEEYTEG